MVSDCCGARLVDNLETKLCSQCLEHCDVSNNTSSVNLNDLIITLESLMKRLRKSGIDDIKELPRVIDGIRYIQQQIYLIGTLIKQTQKEGRNG